MVSFTEDHFDRFVINVDRQIGIIKEEMNKSNRKQ